MGRRRRPEEIHVVIVVVVIVVSEGGAGKPVIVMGWVHAGYHLQLLSLLDTLAASEQRWLAGSGGDVVKRRGTRGAK